MKIIEKANLIYGAIVTALTALLGQYWFLFAGFLILNVADYATGCWKARYYTKKISSAVGAKGIAKKVFYWVVIGVAFFVSKAFVIMGETVEVNLSFAMLFGWFTLATYIINEIRSILENMVEMHVNVPAFLIKGLDVAEKLIEAKEDTEVKEG